MLYDEITNLFDQDCLPIEKGKPIIKWINKHKEEIEDIEKSYIDDLENIKQELKEKESYGLALFATLYELLEEQDPDNVSTRISFCTRQKKSIYDDTYKTIRNLQYEILKKEKEIERLRGGTINERTNI